MNSAMCDKISTQLVDYVDGELSTEQARHIEDHLAACPACAQLVQALDQSLSIAQGLWEDACEKADKMPIPNLASSRTRYWVRYAAVAAGIVLIIGMFCLIPKQSHDTQLSLTQVQEQVQQSARAAQLLAATRMLSECKGTEDLVQQQLDYIQTHYAEVVSNHDIHKEL